MANALGGRSKVGRTKTLILFFAAFLPVATLLFIIAEELHLGADWAFAAGMALIFLWSVGRGYRSKFRDPAFIAFFAGWMTIHVAVFLLALRYVGIAYYIPLALIDLWVGYFVAIRYFGPPIWHQ